MIPGWRFSQNYQFVRPEKNTKYARGTYTLNLKKKILKNVQSLKYVGVFQSSSSIVLCVRHVCQCYKLCTISPELKSIYGAYAV
jgi:hypothetical protein